MSSSSIQKTAAVLNIVAFAIVITVNCMSIFLPLNGKTQMQLSEQYPNLFTPAGATFSIWGIIYTLLFGFIIYQAFVLFAKRQKDKKRILRISPFFVGVCLCNAGWLLAWHYGLITLSVLIMLVHLALLIFIHDRLRLSITWFPLASKIWLDIPFSIYLGWICVATIANVTAWFVDKGITLSIFPPQVWVIIMLVAALLIGIFYVFTHNNKFLALSIAWAFYGIIEKRKAAGAGASHTVVLATEIALAILLLIVFLNTVRRRREQEYNADMSA